MRHVMILIYRLANCLFYDLIQSHFFLNLSRISISPCFKSAKRAPRKHETRRHGVGVDVDSRQKGKSQGAKLKGNHQETGKSLINKCPIL